MERQWKLHVMGVYNMIYYDGASEHQMPFQNRWVVRTIAGHGKPRLPTTSTTVTSGLELCISSGVR